MNQWPKSSVNGGRLVFDVEQEGCGYMAWASDRRAQGRKAAEQWSVLGEQGPLPTVWVRDGSSHPARWLFWS